MERSRLLLYLGLYQDVVQKAMKQAERNKADAYAGPNESYPLYKDGRHLASAWDLAGHADDPQEVRKNILAFARQHNLMSHLPLDAQHLANVMEITRKAFADGEWPTLGALADDAAIKSFLTPSPSQTPSQTPSQGRAQAASDAAHDAAVAKATVEAPEDQPPSATASPLDGDADDSLFAKFIELAWNHETGEGDTSEQQAIIAFCESHGLESLLPAAAQAMDAAEDAQEATGEDGPDDTDTPDLAGVQKAATNKSQPGQLDPAKVVVVDDADGILVAKSMQIMKAWRGDDGAVNIEGWVSTEARDQQKDIVPPESFKAALPEYMARYAPLTTEHQLFPNVKTGQLSRYPVGHMQRIALVRDGAVFQEAVHPQDPADFQHFPGSGTGAYGRGVINDSTAAGQVMKGNMAGFSWVGRLKEYEPLPDGGKRYGRVEPWMETTLSAFPINSSARLLNASRATTPTEE